MTAFGLRVFAFACVVVGAATLAYGISLFVNQAMDVAIARSLDGPPHGPFRIAR